MLKTRTIAYAGDAIIDTRGGVVTSMTTGKTVVLDDREAAFARAALAHQWRRDALQEQALAAFAVYALRERSALPVTV